jgi:hypothetical protein
MHSAVIWLNKRCDPLFDHLQKRGKFVNYWVVNEYDELDDIVEKSSVRVILTDRPQGTIDYLVAKMKKT